MIGHVRKRYPTLKIVLGGGLMTSWISAPGAALRAGGSSDFRREEPLLELLGSATVPSGTTPDPPPLPLKKYFAPG
jgi:hypothetical protein